MRLRKDGWLELTFRTAGWKELVRWILSWQPDVRVLSPKALRDRIREKLELAVKGWQRSVVRGQSSVASRRLKMES